MPKTTRTVFHPNFPDISHEVEEGDVDRWKRAGWRMSKPDAEKIEKGDEKAREQLAAEAPKPPKTS